MSSQCKAAELGDSTVKTDTTPTFPTVGMRNSSALKLHRARRLPILMMDNHRAPQATKDLQLIDAQPNTTLENIVFIF